MKTMSLRWIAYTKIVRLETIEMYQKATGTVTRLRFSLTYHWTTNRAKKRNCPPRPKTTHPFGTNRRQPPGSFQWGKTSFVIDMIDRGMDS